MTDKFAICNMGLNGSFIKENGKIMEIERVVDLLNEQHEQIERLKWNFKALDEVKCELAEENEQLKFENNELKCALALNEVDYIIADGKKIDIPPYYEFEQRYDYVMHRREYDGYD